MTVTLQHSRATWVAAVLGLCSVTLWFFTLMQLYRPIGPDLLSNSVFDDGLAGWQTAGPEAAIGIIPGLVELRNDEPGRQVGLMQTVTVPDGGGLLKLQAEVAAVDVVPGPKSWHSARVYAVPLDADGEPLWGRMTVLAALRADADWRAGETVFDLPQEASAVKVGIQMAWTTGQMQVRALSLVPVEPRDFVAPAKTLLIAGWAVLTAVLGWRLWHAMPAQRHRLALALPLGLLIGGILMPEKLKAVLMAPLLGDPARQDGAIVTAALLQAAGHFLLFVLLALCLRLLRSHGRMVAQMAALSLLAMATEVLQFFSIGRNPRVEDWLIDMAGIAIGMALATSILFLRRGRRMRGAFTRC